jgi:hypothetical protein
MVQPSSDVLFPSSTRSYILKGRVLPVSITNRGPHSGTKPYDVGDGHYFGATGLPPVP